ncbi:MAG: hypothetical protein DMF56_13610 [Acidobacteria bacterium]|nr:MAG: hypothetical protein DMF56_13610 [Acidobacteriota bacterium]
MRRVVIPVVVVILAGGAFAAWQHKKAVEAREQQQRAVALHDTLVQLRKTIDNFHADKGRYPHSLLELVPDYLRRIPVDPMTNSANWRLTTEESVAVSDDFTTGTATKSESVVIDVHSSAPGYGDY